MLPAEPAAANRAKRETTAFSSSALVNVSLEGGKFLVLLGLMPGQDYSLKVATVNAAAVSRFTEWLNVTTTSAGRSAVTIQCMADSTRLILKSCLYLSLSNIMSF